MRLSLTKSIALATLWIPSVAPSSQAITTTKDGAPNMEQQARSKRDNIIALVPRLLTATATVIDKVNNTRKTNGKQKKGLGKVMDIFSNNRRSLSKNVKKAVQKQILKSSLTTKKAAMKGNSLAKNLGLTSGRRNQRKLALSDLLEAYQDMAVEAADLFEDFLAEDGFSFDEFQSPAQFCSDDNGVAVSSNEDCTEGIRAGGTLLRSILMKPEVIYDIVQFVSHNLFLLPWDHILNWNELKEFLHSIPKADLYSAILTELDALLTDMASWRNQCDYQDTMPETYRFVYEVLVVDLLGLESPIEFSDIVDAITTIVVNNFYGIPCDDHFQEYIETIINNHHPEVCYALTLEPVHLDFISNCDGEKNLLKVPFCVSKEFKTEHNGKAFFERDWPIWISSEWIDGHYAEDGEWKEGYWENNFAPCTLTIKFSYIYNEDGLAGDELSAESPDDRFFMKMKSNGDIVTKPCKWLMKKSPAVRKTACRKNAPNNLPEDNAMASEVCPSICCTIPEDPGSTWLRKKETTTVEDDGETVSFSPAEIKTCSWLSGRKSDRALERFCSQKIYSDEATTAYIACPETCGFCPSSSA